MSGGGRATGRDEPPSIRAAGGVVVRSTPDGPEVLLVHRPRYDDWSFPKGKQDAGETDEETALREVHEETGLRCTLGASLGDVHYRDQRDRPKVVRYWVMEPLDDHSPPRTPDNEVDLLLWCRLADAARLLTYAHDRALIGRLREQP